MPTPMRRSRPWFGAELCKRCVWCSENSPARATSGTAQVPSTSASTSWPLDRRLLADRWLTCGSWPHPWLPGSAATQLGLRRAVRQGDSCGDVLVRRIEAEVRPVLVPGDERRVAGLLDPHREVVDEEIRPDQILDGGQHRRGAEEVVEPREQYGSWPGAGPGAARAAVPARPRRPRASCDSRAPRAGTAQAAGQERLGLEGRRRRIEVGAGHLGV